MNDSILGKTVEVGYRLLLLLDYLPEGQYSARWLSDMDFMTIYGKTFGITDTNLHGDSWMRFTEYATRFTTIVAALHELVIRNYVMAIPTKTGFVYQIADPGKKVTSEMQTSYSRRYRTYTNLVYSRIKDFTEDELSNQIRIAALSMLKQEAEHG